MLSDEQLVDRLRSELAPLQPLDDLAELVREQAVAHAPPGGDTRSRGRLPPFRLTPRRLGFAGGVLAAVAVGVVVLVLVGHSAPPSPASRPVGQSHAPARRTPRPALAAASPGEGLVSCRAGVCHQGRRLVRNPGGSPCGQGVWVVARSTVPETTYGCDHRAIAGY